jgi:hypothetical protein
VKVIPDQFKTIANWLHLSRLLPRRIFETHNRVLAIQIALETTQSELRSLSIHLETGIDHLFEQMHELTALQFESHARGSSNQLQWVPHPAECYRRANPKSFAQILADAEHEFPRVYLLWKQRLEATRRAFLKTKSLSGNISEDYKVFGA